MSNQHPTMEELEKVNPHLAHINRMKRRGQELIHDEVYVCRFDGEEFWGKWDATTGMIHGFHETDCEMTDGIEDLDAVEKRVEDHHRGKFAGELQHHLELLPKLGEFTPDPNSDGTTVTPFGEVNEKAAATTHDLVSREAVFAMIEALTLSPEDKKAD